MKIDLKNYHYVMLNDKEHVKGVLAPIAEYKNILHTLYVVKNEYSGCFIIDKSGRVLSPSLSEEEIKRECNK